MFFSGAFVFWALLCDRPLDGEYLLWASGCGKSKLEEGLHRCWGPPFVCLCLVGFGMRLLPRICFGCVEKQVQRKGVLSDYVRCCSFSEG